MRGFLGLVGLAIGLSVSVGLVGYDLGWWESPHPCYTDYEVPAIDSEPRNAPSNLSGLREVARYGLDEALRLQPGLNPRRDFYRVDLTVSDNRLLISESGYYPVIVDLRTYELQQVEIEVDEGYQLRGIAASPGDNLYAFANVILTVSDGGLPESAEFRFWNVEDADDSYDVSLDRWGRLRNMHFLPNNRCAVLIGNYSEIRFVDLASGDEKADISTGWNLGVGRLAMSANGRYLSYSTSGDNDSSGPIIVGVWDLGRNKQILRINPATYVVDMAYHPSGDTLAYVSDGQIYIVTGVTDDTDSRTIAAAPSALAFAGEYYLLGGNADGTLSLWDWRTGDQVDTRSLGDAEIVNMVLSEDEEQIIVLDLDGALTIWALE